MVEHAPSGRLDHVEGSSIAPIMLYTLLIMVVAGMCYGAGMVLARTCSIILERERRENWTKEAALEGKL